MGQIESRSASRRKTWKDPVLMRLTADLGAVAGSRFPPGDGSSGHGKSLVPPGS